MCIFSIINETVETFESNESKKGRAGGTLHCWHIGRGRYESRSHGVVSFQPRHPMAFRSFLLAPPFTADRTYLHGADIFDGIVRHIGGAAADVRLTLTVASDCAIEVREDGAEPRLPAESCGSVSYLDGGIRRQLRLRQRHDLPIRERVPLEEASLIRGAIFDGDRAAIPAGDAPFMRRVTAAGLHLLTTLSPGHYWSIAEIACARIPPGRSPASVTLRRLLGGRYWKAIASAPDSTAGGTILLARGQPRR